MQHVAGCNPQAELPCYSGSEFIEALAREGFWIPRCYITKNDANGVWSARGLSSSITHNTTLYCEAQTPLSNRQWHRSHNKLTVATTARDVGHILKVQYDVQSVMDPRVYTNQNRTLFRNSVVAVAIHPRFPRVFFTTCLLPIGFSTFLRVATGPCASG